MTNKELQRRSDLALLGAYDQHLKSINEKQVKSAGGAIPLAALQKPEDVSRVLREAAAISAGMGISPEAVWILPDGQVIDGRHRVKACGELGRSVDARVYHGEGDAVVDFVVSLNKVRRHLSVSQMAMIADDVRPYYEGPAKDRMLAGKHPVENLPQGSGKSRDQAAKAFGISGKTLDYARDVKSTGTPELQQVVRNGDVSVSAAAEVATLPEEEQRGGGMRW